MLPKKYFSKYKKPLAELPNLVEVQTTSFRWFLEKGLKELFREFSPIKDFAEKELELHFLDYSVEKPKYDEYYAKAHNLSYEGPLKVKMRLVNKKTGETQEQEVFFGNIYLMTPRGTFIVNGVERVIVSQLSRSFGLYLNSVSFRGKNYFGAKIIPSRGAWLEIQTEPDGAIYARLDRKRKIPMTAILRALGLKATEEIKKAFADVGKGETNYIEKTLEKDSSQNDLDASVEIYRRLRPGEPATPENAREFFKKIFSKERYDLSPVGRYRLNRRLNLSLENIYEAPRVLGLEDLIAILKKIIELNNTPGAQGDDIDHLGNRRVRTVGEMLESRLRVGLMRVKGIIQDRMATLDPQIITPMQLVNARPFISLLKEFFNTGQLSQFMSQDNLLSEIEHLRRLSALGPGGLSRERAGIEARDVHPSHYGRICPIQTPEGGNVGLVVHMSAFSRLNEFGIIETPYRKVEKGKITEEIEYLDAFEEAQYSIATASANCDEKGVLLDETAEARVKGRPGTAKAEEINYIDVSPQQAFSVAVLLIPFLEHDDANRAMMGANMQRQAVPPLKPEPPLVATGFEEKVAADSGYVLKAKEDGVIKYADASRLTIDYKNGEENIPLLNFVRSNDFTVIHQRPLVKPGNRVKKGEPIADSSSTSEGQLALGQNVLVAFLSWGGATYEDSIVVSERILENDIFTSVHIDEHVIDVRETKLGPEITTYDIPNVSEERLKNLDEEGIVRIGAEVKPGDILVGKITPKGETELTPEERLLRAIFGEKARQLKDTSYRLPVGSQGRAIGIKIFSREKGDKLDPGIIKKIQVEVAQIRKLSGGDKLSGRHGNKGVVSKILKVEDMPRLEDGTPIDIVLNPLGVISRMNFGQILETHLGLCAKKLGYQAINPVFQGATIEEIKEELAKAEISKDGRLKIYDGRTGEEIKEPVAVGYIYMMKLKHMVEDKIHMRSIGPYSLITQQPLGGKAQKGGQRFGEMEVWALEAHGAAHTLQEILTIKSDDVVGRIASHEAIIRGEPIKPPHIPASFNVLINELRGLGLDARLSDDKEIQTQAGFKN